MASKESVDMEELIHEMATKLGMSDQTAEQAVHMVVDHLKKVLPAPVAEQLEAALACNQGEATTTGIGGMVKKLFGS